MAALPARLRARQAVFDRDRRPACGGPFHARRSARRCRRGRRPPQRRGQGRRTADAARRSCRLEHSALRQRPDVVRDRPEGVARGHPGASPRCPRLRASPSTSRSRLASRWSDSCATRRSTSIARGLSSSVRPPQDFTLCLCSASASRSRITIARWRASRGRTATSCRSRGASCATASATAARSAHRASRDWTLPGTHLCMVRLELMRLNTAPALDPDAARPTSRRFERSSSRELRELGRLPEPMLRRRGRAADFCVASWDEALDRIAAELRAVDPQRVGLLPDLARHHQRGLLRRAEGRALPGHARTSTTPRGSATPRRRSR